MPKDPRFNFYVDNWIGGTEGFTLEQEGAYLSIIIMQSKIGRFTAEQAMDKLLQKTRGNTAVCTALWNFLIPKFETDGNLFWSARLEIEMDKSKKHSLKQTERINKRWAKENGNTAVLPVNSIGSGNRIGNELKGVQGEKFTDEWFNEIFDSKTLDEVKIVFPKHDIPNELKIFRLKVRGSPSDYVTRDSGGLRTAFTYQLSKSNGNRKTNQGSTRRADAVIESGRDFGEL